MNLDYERIKGIGAPGEKKIGIKSCKSEIIKKRENIRYKN